MPGEQQQCRPDYLAGVIFFPTHPWMSRKGMVEVSSACIFMADKSKLLAVEAASSFFREFRDLRFLEHLASTMSRSFLLVLLVAALAVAIAHGERAHLTRWRNPNRGGASRSLWGGSECF